MLKSLKQEIRSTRLSCRKLSKGLLKKAKQNQESVMAAIGTGTFNPHKTHLMNTTAYLTPLISV